MDKVPTTTINIENESLAKLKSVFPQFVKDGEVDFDALKVFFDKEKVLAGEEKYGLSWAGKSRAFKAIRTPATGFLAPQPAESKNWDTTENIFIEGDNLEVLKLLQKHYREKIKMIYIDPPYNTGKDFIYKDNFTQNVADYYEQTGQTKNGIKMTANTEKNGRFHSDWLTMMYPRLFLAHNLLKDDGVIFISIDDNEVHNLRMIMDEIFGEENFVGEFIKQSKVGGGSDSKFIVSEHEYCLVYSKNITSLKEFFVDHEEDYLKRYKEEDEKGKFFWDTLARRGLKNPIRFEVIAPDGTTITDDWNRSRERFDKDLASGEIKFATTKDGKWNVYFKQRLNEDGKKPRSLTAPLGGTMEGKLDIESLFENDKIFSYPKSVQFLSYLASIVTEKDDVILDFFAGSGTTAHAVMDLNNRDNGNRKWISVQLPEVIEEGSEAAKAGYKNIAQISRERIRRAGEKIGKGDIGFKAFVLEKSNYRQWNVLTEIDNEEILSKQVKLFAEKPLVDSFDEKLVVYEILEKEGFDLNAKVIQERGPLKPWVVTEGDKKLVITLVIKINQENIEELGLASDDTLMCLDSALNDTQKINIIKASNLKVI